MNLGFKKKYPWGKPTLFKEKILSGTKIHSIREDKKRRWKVGMLIHMAYGIRTKFYECFCNKHRCKLIQEIRIKYNGKYPTVYIDGFLFAEETETLWYALDDMMILAKNDGFDSVEDFFKWFNKDFEGVIIHWTSFRY